VVTALRARWLTKKKSGTVNVTGAQRDCLVTRARACGGACASVKRIAALAPPDRIGNRALGKEKQIPMPPDSARPPEFAAMVAFSRVRARELCDGPVDCSRRGMDKRTFVDS